MASTSIRFVLQLLIWTLIFASSAGASKTTANTGTSVTQKELRQRRWSDDNCSEDERKRSANCSDLELSEVPNDLQPGIQILILDDNQIETLFNKSFARYVHLKYLTLCRNMIKHIQAATFRPLTHLVHLDMSWNNGIDYLGLNILIASQSLLFLSVEGCNIGSFPQNDTKHTNGLQLNQVHSLMLTTNSFSRINISCPKGNHKRVNIISLKRNAFRELTNESFKLDCDVKELDLADNNIVHIDSYTIAAFQVQSLRFGGDRWEFIATPRETWRNLLLGVSRWNIKHLSLTYTNKKDLHSNFFTPLTNSSLQTLELTSDMDLSALPDLFTPLHFLLKLSIKSFYTYFKSNYFRGLNRLQSLKFEPLFGGITHLNRKMVPWVNVNLQEMNLSYNNIGNIEKCGFLGLTNLSLIDLAFNRNLRYLDGYGLAELPNLRYLNISGTNLQTILLISPLTSLISRDITGPCYERRDIITPSLEVFDLTNSNLGLPHLGTYRTSLFRGMFNLTDLTLKSNPILQLLSRMFYRLPALQFLDLSYCQIRSISADAFYGMKSLRNLTMEHNSIQRLANKMFENLKELVMLNLMENELSFLEINTFVNTTSLETLLLAGNRFTDFNRSSFHPISDSIKRIDISQNPLICNCELVWLVKWLKGPVDELNVTVCSTGSGTLEPLRGKPLLTFDPQRLCGLNVLLISVMPLAAIGLIAAVSAVYHYRWYVNFKIYLLKLACIGYQEILDAREHGDFEFDLNFMFMEDDQQWVQEHLRPILEDRLPKFNNNAFGDDDLPLGMHYFDAVYHIIERSFKTVPLFSRAAFQDNWFMVKFRVAFEQVNDARVENVVVIFLEDIPDEELPFLVRLYLSERRTYLRWVQDEAGQEYFWEKLILTLQRDNARWNNVIPPE